MVAEPLQVVDELFDEYLDWLVCYQPVTATSLGDRRGDDRLPRLTRSELDESIRGLDELIRKARLANGAIEDRPDRQGLAVEAAGDLELLFETLDGRRFWLAEQAVFERDPTAALEMLAEAVDGLLTAVDTSPQSRARSLAGRVAEIPSYLEESAGMLRGAPAPQLALAQRQIVALADLVGRTVPAVVAAGGAANIEFEERLRAALEGLDAYAALLHELQDAAPLPWMLGRRTHHRLVTLALGPDLGTERVRGLALDAATVHRQELAELTGRLWGRIRPHESAPDDPDERIRSALSLLDADGSVRPSLSQVRAAVSEVRRRCENCAFVDLPPPGVLDVAPMPAHRRGLYGAALRVPAPLQYRGTFTYQQECLPEDDERAHAAALRVQVAHETYPGHVVQLHHARHHPRRIRRALASPAFTEGWATYAERLLAQSCGDPLDLLVSTAGQLRLAVGTAVDAALHTGDLDAFAGLGMLEQEGYYTPAGARSELDRIRVSGGGRALYFGGQRELWSLRADVEQRPGFDELAFHRRLLALGAPPLGYARHVVRDLPWPAEDPRRPRRYRDAG